MNSYSPPPPLPIYKSHFPLKNPGSATGFLHDHSLTISCIRGRQLERVRERWTGEDDFSANFLFQPYFGYKCCFLTFLYVFFKISASSKRAKIVWFFLLCSGTCFLVTIPTPTPSHLSPQQNKMVCSLQDCDQDLYTHPKPPSKDKTDSGWGKKCQAPKENANIFVPLKNGSIKCNFSSPIYKLRVNEP